MTSSWEPFVLSKRDTNDSFPQLFIQRNFTKTTYSVFVTDLSNLWGESLSKSRILDRADDQNASIDPSLNDDQLGILLTHLHDALSGTKEHVDVEMDVKQQHESQQQQDSTNTCVLHISTTEDLPKPLRQLFWKFRLKPLSCLELTQQLTIPLISLAATYNHQVKSLCGLLKEKDVVIHKFLDWFDHAKMDIRTMFPGYKKGVRMAGKGKGLLVFDLAQWKSEILNEDNDVDGDNKNVALLMKDAYKGVDGEVLARANVYGRQASKNSNVWWNDWTGKVKVERLEEVQENTQRESVSQLMRRASSDEEDDFEPVSSPPYRPPVEAVSQPVVDNTTGAVDVSMKDDETTTDEGEDDLDFTPSSSFKKRDHTPSSATADGQEEFASSRDKSQVESEPQSELVREDRASSSVRIIEATQDLPASHITISDNGDDEKTADEMDVDVRPVVPPKPKIKRTIGGRKNNENQTDVKALEDKNEGGALPVHITSPKKRTPSPGVEVEENPDEKADRIRKELAASLEAKKKAPAKKKRRF